MRKLYLALACVSVVAILAGSDDPVARKRPSSATIGSSAPDFRTDSTVVLVNVTVTDSRGQIISGLRKENFQVFEEKTAQKVRYFSAEDAPMSVGLVLDFSHSMADKFLELQQAVRRFVETANPEDEFCLIEFRDRASLSIGFTPFPEDIENRVERAEPEGHTALLDAVYLGLRQMKKARNGRRALLVISDGGDNHSRYRRREVENLARESDVEIYTIGMEREEALLGGLESSSGAGLLADLSELGGGRYVGIHNARELRGVAEKIALELRNQYVLGYVSTNPARDGKYRRVQVKVARPAGQPKVWANWKHGYYAPAD